MAGKSPMTASEERKALEALGASRDRGEADRARAVLLTLSGWTSGRISEAFAVREDSCSPGRGRGTAGAGRAWAAAIEWTPVALWRRCNRRKCAMTASCIATAD